MKMKNTTAGPIGLPTRIKLGPDGEPELDERGRRVVIGGPSSAIPPGGTVELPDWYVEELKKERGIVALVRRGDLVDGEAPPPPNDIAAGRIAELEEQLAAMRSMREDNLAAIADVKASQARIAELESRVRESEKATKDAEKRAAAAEKKLEKLEKLEKKD